jgi:catechol 2,3-dioxygenase-like lactoylglutathione lyase family enzyme
VSGITGLAHTGICVPDVEAATAWWRDVMGLEVLSPPYLMEGEAITKDMGELVPAPVRVKAAILGFPGDGDRVLELIEYPSAPGADGRSRARLVDPGLSHIAFVCDDVVATRAELEAKGVRFLVDGIADVASLRTTWFTDPWGVVGILLEKSRSERPYYMQWT